MKKSIRVLALALALLTVVTVLASCGNKLSGEYECKVGLVTVSIKFSGSKATFTGASQIPGLTAVTDGKEVTYKIVDKDDGSQTIEFTVEEGKDPVSMPFSQDKDKKTITLAKLFVFNKK